VFDVEAGPQHERTAREIQERRNANTAEINARTAYEDFLFLNSELLEQFTSGSKFLEFTSQEGSAVVIKCKLEILVQDQEQDGKVVIRVGLPVYSDLNTKPKPKAQDPNFVTVDAY
jgi:hypothetical protein